MKIATFNVNGINARLPRLLEWLETSQPDVVCLQELKAPQERFPHEAIRDAGYGALWHGQKSWNGVAILARGLEPAEVQRGLPDDPDPAQSRYLEATVDGIRVACLYAPNGNPRPGPKYDYKLAWLKAFEAHARSLVHRDQPVVLAGDYNIIPTATTLDVYKPERWVDDALMQPEVQACYSRLLGQGWLDALRRQYPEQPAYTFWDYLRQAWNRNAGLRIDHLLLNPLAAERLQQAGVDRDVRGQPSPSDHAPVWVRLGEPLGKAAHQQPGHDATGRPRDR